MAWECWLAFAACAAIIVAAYFLSRSHAKADGTTYPAMLAQAKEANKQGMPLIALLIAAGWVVKTFVLRGITGVLALICVPFISGVCSGLAFEQIKDLLCIVAEFISGRLPQSCLGPAPAAH